MIGLSPYNHPSTVSTHPRKPTTTPRRYQISLMKEEPTTTFSMRTYKDLSKLINFLNVSTQLPNIVEKWQHLNSIIFIMRILLVFIRSMSTWFMKNGKIREEMLSTRNLNSSMNSHTLHLWVVIAWNYLL